MHIERRYDAPGWTSFVIPTVAVLVALLLGGMLISLMGVSPVTAYMEMFKGALGDSYGLSETIVKAIPLILAGIAVALAFSMTLWNIGAEGQLVMGALASAALVRHVTVDNWFVMFCLMFLAAGIAGGLWAALTGYLKARWNVNEIITTLMMNYIALLGLDYFVYGPWRDPTSLGFPMTPPFPEAARIPQLFGTRVHLGILLALLFAVLYRVLMRWTQWGFEIRVTGENPRGAEYAGINTTRNVVLVMFLSGAVAGLAGMCELAGLQGRLQPGFSVGYGYTAIIVAWLARLHPVGIIVVSFLMGALLVGGDTLQIVMGLPLSSVQVLQGLILFSVLGGDFFRRYRIRFPGKGGRA
ncbi:MAG: ABC transporter permease [Synergistales bacterium]|nr:ABC transporter permease [Synergistales bacterium]